LLLPGGPRTVRGRVVRETVLARGVGLAIAFSNVDRGDRRGDQLRDRVAADQVMPAKLRVAGVDRTLRCEGRVDDGTVRLTATLPFLRIDGGVDVVLGEHGEMTEHGVIKKIAVDPSTSDGVPRLAVDVALAHDTQPTAPTAGREDTTPPPTRAAAAVRAPLPSVLVSPGLVRDVRTAEERPPRRRVHSTAEISRRPRSDDGPGPRRRRSWSAADQARAPARPAQRLTARIGALGATAARPAVAVVGGSC
jgi:hypothetical protein